MTEFSDFNQVMTMTEPSSNGHEGAAEPTAPAAKAHLDPARGVFITSKGNEIELSGKLISSLMLERLTNEDKPRIPMKEVLILGKHKQMEANPNDPGYLALLKEWEINSLVKGMIYVLTLGVKGKPDAEFVEEQRAFFPNVSDTTLKYLWVASQLPDEDINALQEVILGKSIPTTKGIEEVAESFRS